MNGSTNYNPLTPAHQEIVTQGCAQCEQLERYLDDLDKTGVDTTEYRDKLAGFSHLFNRIREMWVNQ